MLRDVCVITPTVVTLLKAYLKPFPRLKGDKRTVEFRDRQLFFCSERTLFSPHDQNPKFKARTREHFFFFFCRGGTLVDLS